MTPDGGTIFPSMDTETLGAFVAAIGLGGTAIYQAGVLRGRFEHHETTTVKRLDVLEGLAGGRVTREELDARFTSIAEQLGAIARAVDKLHERG